VIGFEPTERPSEAFLSLVVYPRCVSVCFLQAVKLPESQNILNGQGKQVRFVWLENAKILDKRAIKTLISEAVKLGGKPLSPKNSEQIIVKLISANQRSRRSKTPSTKRRN
jgi:hypothetical protein